LASDLKVFSADQYGCALLQYMDDLLLVGPTWEDCMKGTCLFLSLLWEAGTKCLGRRPRFAKTPSNTLAFTCHRGNIGSTLGENKLSVQFWPPRPIDKSEFLRAMGLC
jgi:hypothetical protein